MSQAQDKKTTNIKSQETAPEAETPAAASPAEAPEAPESASIEVQVKENKNKLDEIFRMIQTATNAAASKKGGLQKQIETNSPIITAVINVMEVAGKTMVKKYFDVVFGLLGSFFSSYNSTKGEGKYTKAQTLELTLQDPNVKKSVQLVGKTMGEIFGSFLETSGEQILIQGPKLTEAAYTLPNKVARNILFALADAAVGVASTLPIIGTIISGGKIFQRIVMSGSTIFINFLGALVGVSEMFVSFSGSDKTKSGMGDLITNVKSALEAIKTKETEVAKNLEQLVKEQLEEKSNEEGEEELKNNLEQKQKELKTLRSKELGLKRGDTSSNPEIKSMRDQERQQELTTLTPKIEKLTKEIEELKKKMGVTLAETGELSKSSKTDKLSTNFFQKFPEKFKKLLTNGAAEKLVEINDKITRAQEQLSEVNTITPSDEELKKMNNINNDIEELKKQAAKIEKTIPNKNESLTNAAGSVKRFALNLLNEVNAAKNSVNKVISPEDRTRAMEKIKTSKKSVQSSAEQAKNAFNEVAKISGLNLGKSRVINEYNKIKKDIRKINDKLEILDAKEGFLKKKFLYDKETLRNSESKLYKKIEEQDGSDFDVKRKKYIERLKNKRNQFKKTQKLKRNSYKKEMKIKETQRKQRKKQRRKEIKEATKKLPFAIRYPARKAANIFIGGQKNKTIKKRNIKKHSKHSNQSKKQSRHKLVIEK